MNAKDDLLHSAEQACQLLKCLANPHRLMLICHLLEGRKSVGELVELVGTGQSNMSQHLGQLRLSGIVTTEREAQTIYYSVASTPAREIIKVLYQQFCAGKTAPQKRSAPRGRSLSQPERKKS